MERPKDESSDKLMTEPEVLPKPWTLFTDGSSCTDGSGAGLILINPEGVEFTYAMRFRFEAINNEAEYEALLAGLRIAKQMGVQNLQANVDSRLIANQVNGSYVAKELGMVQYLEELKEKSINKKEVLAVVEEEGHTWMTDICQYLTKETLSEDKKKARAVHRKAARYTHALRPQVHRPVPRNPQQNLTTITSPWPFYKWEIDIAGPFSKGPGKVKFLIVAIDYFTKWIEAKPVATITGNQIKKFTNGLVERANRSLGEGIKARLEERSKDWMGELSHILWAHRTMIKSSNEETPFSLTYGTEAVIPAEIGMPTLRTAEIDLAKNDEALEINLDLIRKKENMQQFKKQKANNDASHAKDGGKLGPKWEGPYRVTESLGKGAYKLKDSNGSKLPRT
ncbi:reverse transcriptase domain-containing protein [Tanacetum coccineum]